MTETDNSLQLLDDIVVTDHAHRPKVCLGLRQTFYIGNGTSNETRQRIGRCASDYLDRFAEKIKKKRVTCDKWRKSTKLDMDAFIERRCNPSNYFFISYTGANDWSELDWYTYEAAADMVEITQDREFATVTFSIPLSALESLPRGSFQQMMKEWIAILEPVHAYGGFSAIFPIDGWSAQKLTYPLLMRFPGLDHDAPIWFNDVELSRGVKGAHWLVYLNRGHIERLGGLEKLTADLGEGFAIDPIGEGVLVQAGATPQLGDVNQNLLPRYYYRLGKVLAPIRIVISTNNYLKPKGEDPILKTQEWLARFDGGIDE